MSRNAVRLASYFSIIVALLMLYIGYDLIGSGFSSERSLGGTLVYVWLLPFAGGLVGLLVKRRA